MQTLEEKEKKLKGKNETHPFLTFQGEPCNTRLFFKEKQGRCTEKQKKKKNSPVNNTQQLNNIYQVLLLLNSAKQILVMSSFDILLLRF